jgi:hypothetical protein
VAINEIDMKAKLAFNLDPRRITLVLTVIMLLLVTIHILAMLANFNESLGWKNALDFDYWQIAIFDLDEEESFGTWFSAILLLFASLLMIYVARHLRSSADVMSRWWMVLGLGFGLMSIDEVVGVHELLNTLYESSPWTGAGFFIVILVGLCYLPFLWRYRWHRSSLFLMAGILFASGAVGVERYSGTELNSLKYNMLTGLEEGLEMAGVILLIYTVLDFIEGFSAHKQPVRPSEIQN